MGPRLRSQRTALPALAIACALSAPGCGFAVKHPAITAGISAGTLGFATCKLASDDYAACGLVAGGAAAFLGLVTAAALWLGGDGDSAAIEEPLPELLEEGPAPPADAPPSNTPPADPRSPSVPPADPQSPSAPPADPQSPSAPPANPQSPSAPAANPQSPSAPPASAPPANAPPTNPQSALLGRAAS